ncbi:hypothetical protein FQR65_LT06581 [Abscondita terminalis]|nr:hypothetical protein FQR65_LT06581 [Abscondita terminalis]
MNCVSAYQQEPEKICNENREKYWKCFMQFSNEFDKCLEDSEKNLNILYLNAHNASIIRRCTSRDIHLYLQMQNIFTFYKDSIDSILSTYVNKCLSFLKIVQNLYNYDDVTTVKDVCEDIKNFTNCFKLEDCCSKHIDLYRYLELGFDSYLSSCSKQFLKLD